MVLLPVEPVNDRRGNGRATQWLILESPRQAFSSALSGSVFFPTGVPHGEGCMLLSGLKAQMLSFRGPERLR